MTRTDGTTVTAREKEIRDMADALHVAIGKAKAHRMAKRLVQRELHGPIETNEFWLVYGHYDETPAKAIRNLERKQS